ncbi:hypothetical protein BHE74_00002683 [Ensete ventricosum]|nr:hypothetical protein GW17_00046098 [Ensete ventricosum]RWW88440.1 hypothetical protein BHE74_00002683 [Ensete ventricosum]RZS03331.1 hypothetical protein BHM03_00033506 [Ensete ventricosum]
MVAMQRALYSCLKEEVSKWSITGGVPARAVDGPRGGKANCTGLLTNRRWTPRMDDGGVRLLFLYTRQKRNDNDECLVSVLAERDSKPLPPDSPTPSELCSLFLLWPSFAI